MTTTIDDGEMVIEDALVTKRCPAREKIIVEFDLACDLLNSSLTEMTRFPVIQTVTQILKFQVIQLIQTLIVTQILKFKVTWKIHSMIVINVT